MKKVVLVFTSIVFCFFLAGICIVFAQDQLPINTQPIKPASVQKKAQVKEKITQDPNLPPKLNNDTVSSESEESSKTNLNDFPLPPVIISTSSDQEAIDKENLPPPFVPTAGTEGDLASDQSNSPSEPVNESEANLESKSKLPSDTVSSK
ncbi:MAG: hypothetical protein WCY09_01150 [Candidatus Omnitrophota bacterium]